MGSRPRGGLPRSEPPLTVHTFLTIDGVMQSPAWQNTTVISTDAVDAVAALKDRPGRELQVHGSWQLARTLHAAGRVDEYRLLVFPVVVVAGATYQVLRPTPFTTGTVSVEDGREVHAYDGGSR